MAAIGLTEKMAHEFNNILMGIQAQAELLARHRADDEHVQEITTAIVDSVELRGA